MNKKITTWLVVGFIFVVTIIVGRFILIQNGRLDIASKEKDILNSELNLIKEKGQLAIKPESIDESTPGVAVVMNEEEDIVLNMVPFDYDSNYGRWNYKVSWDKQRIAKGSLLIGDAVYVADMGALEAVYTGYNLLPDTEYEINFYAENNKKGGIIFSKKFKTLPHSDSSAVVQVQNPPITQAVGPKKPTQTPVPISSCKVRAYADKFYGGNKECLDKVWVKGVYFVAKDQKAGFQVDWSKNMLDIFAQVKEFYENQFDGKIDITVDKSPILIYGEKNIGEYSSTSIAREVFDKISNDFPKDGSYIDIQTYAVDGANGVNGSNLYNGYVDTDRTFGSVNPNLWLNSESLGTVTTKYGTDYSGYLGSAHEFGHSLHMPHPWEEEQNKGSDGSVIDPDYGNDEEGSIMSYTGQRGPLNSKSFVRAQVKKRMIVSE